MERNSSLEKTTITGPSSPAFDQGLEVDARFGTLLFKGQAWRDGVDGKVRPRATGQASPERCPSCGVNSVSVNSASEIVIILFYIYVCIMYIYIYAYIYVY